MTIKELREKYNLTQSALARSLGVSSNAISGIEGGRIKLSPKMAAKIKEVYGEEVTAPGTAPTLEKKPAKNAAPKEKAAAEAVVPVETPVEKKAAAEATAPVVEKKAPAKKAPAKKAPKKKAAVENPVEKKAVKKAGPKKTADKVAAEAAAPVEAATPVVALEEKKAPAKKAAGKKNPAPKKATPKKPAPAKKAAVATPAIILQSLLGGEISAEEILSKVGDVDKVYVRIDQNKLYWVKGDETGDKDIW